MIQHTSSENFKREYGILCQRVYPKAGVETPFGSSWCVVEPGGATAPHDHFEGETFFILRGEGKIAIDDEISPVKKGDVVYIPAFSRHELTNGSDVEPLEFLSVWWNPTPPEGKGPEKG